MTDKIKNLLPSGEPLLICPCIKTPNKKKHVRDFIYRDSIAAAQLLLNHGQSHGVCPFGVVHFAARQYAAVVISCQSFHHDIARAIHEKTITATMLRETRDKIEKEAITLIENTFHQLEADIMNLPDLLAGTTDFIQLKPLK